ncbi:MAG: aminofutalosine synthase MqnE [bacterium]|nr:aminofutalosine synthase MqnE [bacterium]
MKKNIRKKINDNAALNRDECLYLFQGCSIHELGEMANLANLTKNKGKVFFNVNRHINLTNVCISRCKFCAFSRDKGEKGAYVFSVDDVIEKVKESLPMGITEVHIVSGLHPDLTFDYYLDILRAVKKFAPQLHIQGFTAVEIHYFAKITGFTITKVLEIMKEAGLDSLPGGGAEVFSPRIREELCPKKATGFEWQEVMTEAHRLGMKSNATLLFGHIETIEEVVDHLISLRELQNKTGGFQSFIPLPFHPQYTLMENFEKPTGIEILKMLSASRLILNNFTHIKAFWIMMGLRLAQLSLKYGVNDLDGTVVEEKITHSAGATTPEDIPRLELIRLIREMGRIPVERDTLYNEIKQY